MAQNGIKVGESVGADVRAVAQDFEEVPLEGAALVQYHLRIHFEVFSFLIFLAASITNLFDFSFEVLLLFLIIIRCCNKFAFESFQLICHKCFQLIDFFLKVDNLERSLMVLSSWVEVTKLLQ